MAGFISKTAEEEELIEKSEKIHKVHEDDARRVISSEDKQLQNDQREFSKDQTICERNNFVGSGFLSERLFCGIWDSSFTINDHDNTEKRVEAPTADGKGAGEVKDFLRKYGEIEREELNPNNKEEAHQNLFCGLWSYPYMSTDEGDSRNTKMTENITIIKTKTDFLSCKEWDKRSNLANLCDEEEERKRVTENCENLTEGSSLHHNIKPGIEENLLSLQDEAKSNGCSISSSSTGESFDVNEIESVNLLTELEQSNRNELEKIDELQTASKSLHTLSKSIDDCSSPRGNLALEKRYSKNYLRMSSIAESVEFAPNSNVDDVSDFTVRTFAARLRHGFYVIMHNSNTGIRSSSREKILYLNEDGKSISFSSPKSRMRLSSQKKKRARYDLSECLEIRHAWDTDTSCPSLSGTKTLRKKVHESGQYKSFSMIFPKKIILDFTAQTSDQCFILIQGLTAFCLRLQIALLPPEKLTDINQRMSLTYYVNGDTEERDDTDRLIYLGIDPRDHDDSESSVLDDCVSLKDYLSCGCTTRC